MTDFKSFDSDKARRTLWGGTTSPPVLPPAVQENIRQINRKFAEELEARLIVARREGMNLAASPIDHETSGRYGIGEDYTFTVSMRQYFRLLPPQAVASEGWTLYKTSEGA